MIGTDRWRSEPPYVYPPAKAGHMAKRRVGVEYSPSMLEPVRPGAVSPDRALYLPTFSHFVIVKKTSLSLSLSLSLKTPRGLECVEPEGALALRTFGGEYSLSSSLYYLKLETRRISKSARLIG